MIIILVTALYTAACIGLGALSVRVVLGEVDSKSLALQFGLGSTFLSAIWILVALLGFLIPTVVWPIVVALAVYAVFKNQPVRPLSFEIVRQRSITFWMSLIVVSAVLLWHGILAFYRPPFGDADAFYMTYPKIIAATGRLSPMVFTYHDFSTVGLSGEMHFAALMAILSPTAAKLFAWIVGLGIVFLMSEMTGRLGGKRLAKILIAASLATSTTFTDYLSDGKTELFATLSALTVIALLVHRRTIVHSVKAVLLVGIVTGIMAYAKFSYIICMLPTVFTLLFFTSSAFSNEKYLKHFARELIIAGVGFGIGLLPHLIKNWMLFGNAAAPFLGMKSNWADQGHWFSALDTAWIVGTFPFSLVFGKYPLMGGSLSLIWLMGLPFTAFVFIRPGAFKTPSVQVSVCALIGLVCWLIVKPSVFAPRYFLPNLVLLMPLPFIGIERYAAWPNRSRVVLGIFGILTSAVVLTSFSNPPAGVWTATPSFVYRYVKNSQPKCGLAISDYCATFDKLNHEIPDGRRLFVLGYYTYWLSEDLLQRLNTEAEYLAISTQPQNVWQILDDQGFSAVAVQTASHGQYLSYLRNSPAPAGIEIIEQFSDSNMPVFIIRRKPDN